MISNFKYIPYFNILQNLVENVRKAKNPLSWAALLFVTPHLLNISYKSSEW